MKLEILMAPHHQVAERVEQEVRHRTSGRIRGLQVRVFDGQVVITGPFGSPLPVAR